MMPEEDFFEQLRKQYASGLPFVAYRKPGNPSVLQEGNTGVKAVLQQDDKLHLIKDFSEKGFVFSPFDHAEKGILIPCPTAGKGTTVLLSGFQKKETEAATEPNDRQSTQHGRETEDTARDRHMGLVQKGIETIRKGKLEKVVLSRTEEVQVMHCEPVAIFKKLLERYEDAFCYIWFHPKAGLWLGATPETLVRISGCVLHTMALAGTQKYTGNVKVSWGEKEKQEQQVVTDSIVDSLRYKVKSLKISGAGTHRAGNLLHIRTDIQATLIPEYKTKNIAPLLKSLHPTPAVCGFPKDEARLFILENEGYDRSFYSGFLGELNTDISGQQDENAENRDSELYVNLRCMQMNGNTATLYVGGGITRDSDPRAEWEETVNKSFTMKEILD